MGLACYRPGGPAEPIDRSSANFHSSSCARARASCAARAALWANWRVHRAMPKKKPDLARACAGALVLVACVVSLLVYAGRKLGTVLASDDGLELDMRLARWLNGNFSARHAWRNPADGQHTFARLKSLPGARVLRQPELRLGRQSGLGSWIVQTEGFIAAHEAQAIIRWAEGSFRLGATAGFNMYDVSVRNSSVAWCTWRSACGASAHVSRLLSRVEGALGIGRAHFEDMQVVRYYPGEFYREHLDVPGLARTRQQRADALNPRILTAFVYLSDVPADGGGETAFTKLVAKGVEPVKPKLGRLLVWPNVWTDEPAIADRRMYHEARELKRGVKFGANVWVRLHRLRH